MPGFEGLTPENLNNTNKTEKKGFFEKASDNSQLIVQTLGVAALISLFGIHKDNKTGETKDLPSQSLKINGGSDTPDTLANQEYNFDQDQEKIHDNYESYQEITKTLGEFATGELGQGNYKDQLLSLELTKDEIGIDYLAIIDRILENTDQLSGEDRWNAFGESLNYLLNFYTQESEKMNSEQQEEFKQESALAFGTFINEFMSQKKAGDLEHSVQIGQKAGLVQDINQVLEVMNSSETTATVKAENVTVYDGDEKTDLGEGTAYLQAVGDKVLELPLSEANNVKFTNLYDLSKTDPQEYQETLDNILKYNADYLLDNYKEKTGQDINKDELLNLIKDSIENSSPAESTKLIPNVDRFTLDYNFDKLFKIIPILEWQASWGDNKDKYAINYDMTAMGGRIKNTMLCEGNHIQLISLSEDGTVTSPDRTTLSIPLIAFLLPLIAVKRKRKETDKPDKEHRFKITIPFPRGIKPPPPDPITPPPFYPGEYPIPFPTPPPPPTYPGEPSIPKKPVNPFRVNDDGQLELFQVAGSTSESTDEQIVVYAVIDVDKNTGKVRIISTGETDTYNPKQNSQFGVTDVQ